jgi:hypothetical protein
MVRRSSWNPVDCATPMYPRCHGQSPAAVAPGCPVACTIPDSSPGNARSERVPLRCEATSRPRNRGVGGQHTPERAGRGARRCARGERRDSTVTSIRAPAGRGCSFEHSHELEDSTGSAVWHGIRQQDCGFVGSGRRARRGTGAASAWECRASDAATCQA